MLFVYVQSMTWSNKQQEQKKEKMNAYSTRCSQAVTHPSTIRARRCLTSVIRREPVCSTWYGRRRDINEMYADILVRTV